MNLFCFSLLFIVARAQVSPWDTLTTKIVVVEFQTEQNSSATENDKINSNLVKYSRVMNFSEEATNEQVDMYIFPELSLGIGTSTSEEIQVEDNPCNQSSYRAPLTALSCFAKAKSTYLITNVVERAKCENDSDNENCKNFGFYFYNTNLVFDRNGTIILKYRKYNLFGEKPLDRPEVPQIATFQTDFGIKFGVFTCFDILFQNPAQDLLKEDIDGIIFPAYWHGELPFLTALQSQQMFAYEHDVMLFASGGNAPGEASGGTAVFRGSKDSLFNVIVAEGGTQSKTYESVNGEVVLDEETSVDVLAEEMDAFPLMVDDSLYNYTWVPLNTSQTSINERVCHSESQFCCTFTIQLTSEEAAETSYRYFMGAFSGVRYYPEICNSGIEVCALIACLNSSTSSCGRRFPTYSQVEWPVTFNQIAITARFEVNENKTQFPNSLLASIRPIAAKMTNWTKETVEEDGREVVERTFSTGEQNRLLAFGIYGRNFQLDVFPRDKNGTGDDDDDDGNAGSSTMGALVLVAISVLMVIL